LGLIRARAMRLTIARSNFPQALPKALVQVIRLAPRHAW
jgi:hypothetical protein